MRAAALSGHQHGDDLPGPALCLHEVPPRHRPAEMGAHSARSGGIPRLFLAVWHLVLAVRRGRPGEIDRVAVHCAVPAVHARGSAAGLCRHSVGAGYTGRSGRAVLCLGDAEERGLSALFPAYASRDRDLYSAIMLPPCPSLDTAIFALERGGKTGNEEE